MKNIFPFSSFDKLKTKKNMSLIVVHLFDATTGKPLNDGKPWAHKMEIIEVALDQASINLFQL